MRVLLIYLLFSVCGHLYSQESLFKVEVSVDTVLMDNYVEVRFTMENIDGTFEAPSFGEFNVVGGPNVSSSMSIINGDVTKKESYSYFLQPKNVGKIYIEEAYVESGEGQLSTKPFPIIVLENPEGIKQDAKNFKQKDVFELSPNIKKKRKKSKVKRYKI